MPARPTVRILRGCGTCRSSSSPTGSWWPPANGATTSASGCCMPMSHTRPLPIPGLACHPRLPTPADPVTLPSTPSAPTRRFASCSDAAEVPTTMASMAESRLRLISIYPVLLGTYGDGGNLRVLTSRARARGIDVDSIELDAGEPVPDSADLYLLGGGEDDAQVAAARALRADGGLTRAATKGATVFGVCAGYQLLGAVFPGSDGVPEPGLGLLDVSTERLPKRAVGELLATPCAAGLQDPLTGYENHAGATRLGTAAQPLARVEVGIGNGTSDAGEASSEGAVQGHLIGTYLHGPGLARNPELADLLLSWVVGAPLEPWPQADVNALRAERLAAVSRGRR